MLLIRISTRFLFVYTTKTTCIRHIDHNEKSEIINSSSIVEEFCWFYFLLCLPICSLDRWMSFESSIEQQHSDTVLVCSSVFVSISNVMNVVRKIIDRNHCENQSNKRSRWKIEWHASSSRDWSRRATTFVVRVTIEYVDEWRRKSPSMGWLKWKTKWQWISTKSWVFDYVDEEFSTVYSC